MREKQDSLARAVEKLTSEPARLFPLEGRGGVVKEGAFADLKRDRSRRAWRVLAPEVRAGLPAGASRYIQRGTGIRHRW